MLMLYYESEDEFEVFHQKLKLAPCPVCKKVGMLILNGKFFGYCEHSDNKEMRGHRMLCSGKGNRKGCGKSFCALLSSFIRSFSTSANTLWHLLLCMLQGYSKAQTIRSHDFSCSNSNIYRLSGILQRGQSRIRALLSRYFPTPDSSDSNNPAIKTALHLKHAFSGCKCPISAFQHYFQASFL